MVRDFLCLRVWILYEFGVKTRCSVLWAQMHVVLGQRGVGQPGVLVMVILCTSLGLCGEYKPLSDACWVSRI